ncbi:MAG: aspartate aminotransferase family protein, partial [Paralcaligenes sp.]
FYERLGAQTQKLANGIADRADAAGVSLSTDHIGGMFGIYFSERIPTSFAEASNCNVERFKKFFHAMLLKGVYFAPSAFEAGFVSAAHDDAVIQATLDAAEQVFAKQ